MSIRTIASACLLMFATAPLLAADWANDLFAERNHDFGTVAGVEVEHVFEFTNTFDAPLHVSSVRASCGCTTPIIETDTVQPGETGRIRARLNTRSFLGQRGATVTVVFDSPRYGEAQLRVDGYVRKDVVCNPGELDFGAVTVGSAAERKIDVQYAGRSDWQITGYSSTIEGLNLAINETMREGGRVGYDVVATFEPQSSGMVLGEVTLITSDGEGREVPIAFSAQASETISVSPNPLVLGSMSGTEPAAKKIVLKSDQPFRITGFRCDDPRVRCEFASDASKLHIVPVTVAMDSNLGDVSTKLTIETDSEHSATIVVSVEAQVSGNE